jgi:hypothetical protein
MEQAARIFDRQIINIRTLSEMTQALTGLTRCQVLRQPLAAAAGAQARTATVPRSDSEPVAVTGFRGHGAPSVSESAQAATASESA